MTDMVERVARALFDVECCEEREFAENKGYWLTFARAAIEAMRPATPEMHRAGEIKADGGSGANYIWSAMVDAALVSQPPDRGGG